MPAIDVGIIVTAVNNATSGIREIKGEVEGLGVAGQETANRLKAIQVVIASIVIDKISQLGKSFITTSAGVEVLQTRLGLLTGDWTTAGETLNALIEKYEKAGVSGEELAKVYLQLREVGKDNNGALALVDAIAKLNAATDRSPEKIASMGDALTKMLAKGTVDMRVLITVLSSQFPAGIAAAATAAGEKSVEAFTALAKAGKITATQFIKYFQDGIQQQFGTIFDLTSGQMNTGLNRITHLWQDAIRKLSLDTPVGGDITVRLNAIHTAIMGLVDKVTADQVKAFFDVLDNIGTIAVNAAKGLSPFAGLFAGIGAAAAKMIASLPPEALTAGIIGYLVFGRAGAAGIAIAVAALDKMGVTLKTDFVQDIVGYLNSSAALGLGVFGLIMFGPLGAAGLAILGAKLEQFRQEHADLFKGGILEVSPAISTIGTQAEVATKTVQGLALALNSASSNASKIASAAAGLGYNRDAIAGILTGVMHESAFDSTAVNKTSGAFGMFQMLGDELKQLKANAIATGKPLEDVDLQIRTFFQNLQNMPANAKANIQLLGAKSPAEGSLGSTMYERFADWNKGAAETQARMRDTVALVGIWDGAISTSGQKLTANGQQLNAYTQNLTNVNKVLQDISKHEQVPLHILDGDLTDVERKKLDGVKEGLAQTEKQATALNAALNDPTPVKMADQVNQQYNLLKTTLEKNIAALKDFGDTLGDKPTIQKTITAEYERQKGLLDQLNANRDSAITKERTIGELLVSQQVSQQKILQMKADEAALTLKLQYSNNALVNVLGGTSGGQITMQVEQERLKLMQQIQQYESQVAQLQQQRIKSNDPEEQRQIDITISKYTALAAATRGALANLSAEAVAQKQLWNSVGAALETGAVSAITALVMHTGTLKQVTLQMYTAITQAAAKYLIQLLMIQAIKPLLGGMGIGGGFSGLFSGLFAANGAVVPGGVKMFANGGIIGGPTLFGMAGEAGTEAIMPLTNVGGKLGVRAVGGGDQYHVSLSAIDTQTGIEFLLKNLQTISAGLSQRKLINRGGRLG
jgi:tape measure domain-containing protein